VSRSSRSSLQDSRLAPEKATTLMYQFLRKRVLDGEISNPFLCEKIPKHTSMAVFGLRVRRDGDHG